MLKNKTIVITGASSGAGRAIALEFAVQQSTLVLAARNEKALVEVAEECRGLGARVTTLVTDVTNAGEMLTLAHEADIFGGQIDIWVNNAGLLAAGAFEDTPMAVHKQVIDTNLIGYMNGAHAVLPYFKKQGHGVLINNISVGAFLPVPFGVGYSASKYGLRGFSAALKAELREWSGIHICDAFPAFLDTPGIQHAANYTGKQLKPAPPVYDPRRLAMAVVKLAEHPQSEVMVGSISTLLRLSYSLFPGLTRGITAKVINYYLDHADRMPKSDGNVFGPVKYGNAVYGGWGAPGKPKAHRKYIATGILMVAALGILALRKK